MLPICLLLAQTQSTETPSKILQFCEARIGQKVGSGQCAALASEAIRSIDPKFRRPKDEPAPEDYVWGEFVYGGSVTNGKAAEFPDSQARTQVKPGDIIQFRDVKFEYRDSRSWYTSSYGHHTSVVRSVSSDGLHWKVLHQNVNGRMTVGEDSINLEHMRSGYFNVYRFPKK